jgi:hypothetical protein
MCCAQLLQISYLLVFGRTSLSNYILSRQDLWHDIPSRRGSHLKPVLIPPELHVRRTVRFVMDTLVRISPAKPTFDQSFRRTRVWPSA